MAVAPTKTEGRDLSKKNLNASLQAVWEKTQQSLFFALIISLSKGSNFLLFTMVKKLHVLPYKLSTLLYHPLLPIYIKIVYSKHIICQQLVNQVFPSSNISH